MARLHLRHRNIAPEVLEAVKTINSQKPWQLPRDERSAIVTDFAAKLCTLGEIQAPSIYFNRGRSRRPFVYAAGTMGSLGLSTSPASLNFYRWRTVEVIAGVRHHINVLTGDEVTDPIEWACSAFYQAAPTSFRTSARNGKVPGVEAKDTFTTESWLKIMENGLADSRGRLRFPIATVLYFLANNDFPPVVEEEEEPAPSTVSVEGSTVTITFPDEVAEQIEDDLRGDAAALAMEASENDEHPAHPEVPAMAEDDAPEQADTEIVESESTDGLDDLGIVQLRKVSRGFVSGGYSMTKPVLIHALRQSDISSAEIASRIAQVTA